MLDPDQDLKIILSNENKIEEMKTHLLHIPTSTSLKGSVHSPPPRVKNVLRALLPYTKGFFGEF